MHIASLKGVSLLASNKEKHIKKRLQLLGAYVVETIQNDNIPYPVSYHADMQYLFIKDKVFTLKGNTLPMAFRKSLLDFTETRAMPGDKYPKDILCNALYIGNRLFANLQYTDISIIEYAKFENIKLVDVSQGYAACSCCALNECSLITADSSIATAAKREGLRVLEIIPGHIKLPGYNYGFIGGCFGLINDSIAVFTGSLETHPDGKKIKDFITGEGLDILELTDNELLDIGGIKQLHL